MLVLAQASPRKAKGAKVSAERRQVAHSPRHVSSNVRGGEANRATRRVGGPGSGGAGHKSTNDPRQNTRTHMHTHSHTSRASGATRCLLPPIAPGKEGSRREAGRGEASGGGRELKRELKYAVGTLPLESLAGSDGRQEGVTVGDTNVTGGRWAQDVGGEYLQTKTPRDLFRGERIDEESEYLQTKTPRDLILALFASASGQR